MQGIGFCPADADKKTFGSLQKLFQGEQDFCFGISVLHDSNKQRGDWTHLVSRFVQLIVPIAGAGVDVVPAGAQRGEVLLQPVRVVARTPPQQLVSPGQQALHPRLAALQLPDDVLHHKHT